MQHGKLGDEMDAMVMVRAVPVDRKTYSFECDGNLFGGLGRPFVGIAAWHWPEKTLARSLPIFFIFYRQGASLLRV